VKAAGAKVSQAMLFDAMIANAIADMTNNTI
jgi:hypothetical protein